MKKLICFFAVAAIFGCGDRDRIYKEEPGKGDITIIKDLGGQSCVCTNNQCQCSGQQNQCSGQGQGQGQSQGQWQGQGQHQNGQPVTITINNTSSATNKVDVTQCSKTYAFASNNTFQRNVQCQNGITCQSKGTWTPVQQSPQQQSPVYNLEYTENECGDCQSEILKP